MTPSIDRVLATASKVKLTGGLVGRVCSVLVVACLALGTVGALSKNEWIMGGSIVSIVLLAFPLLWRIINFADKNPGVAILDGAQFLKHEQMRLASKTTPEIVVLPSSQTADPSPVSSEMLELGDEMPDPPEPPKLGTSKAR